MVDISIIVRGEVWLQEPVREALEGATCVLGALQFGNDPGFIKHDWDADGYSCSSLPQKPSSQVSCTSSTSELTDSVDSVLFPPSLPSTPPDVSSLTSTELTDSVDSVLFPPSLPSTPPDFSSITSSELTDLVHSVLFPPSLPSTHDVSSLTSYKLTWLKVFSFVYAALCQLAFGGLTAR